MGLTGGPGADIFSGGDGFDTASYSDHSNAQGVKVTVGDGPNDGHATDGDAKDDVLGDTEAVVGSPAADELVGDGGSNRLDGNRGNDILRGRAGNDTLLTGSGEYVTDEPDVDTLYGEAGNDTFLAQSRSDLIAGGLSVYTHDDADVLVGGEGTGPGGLFDADDSVASPASTTWPATARSPRLVPLGGKNNKVSSDIEDVVGSRGDDVVIATGNVRNRLHSSPVATTASKVASATTGSTAATATPRTAELTNTLLGGAGNDPRRPERRGGLA